MAVEPRIEDDRVERPQEISHAVPPAGRLVEGAFGCAGERCMASSTAVVIGSAAKEVLPALVEAARAIKVGPTDRDEQPNMGR
ncbi:MAG: aldehyde dehydrogenase family protein [Verrucomicrobiota bacterium]|nr:aldehyde dehydrogenase family protein [Verrucomicrobiota bacterium]